MAKVYPIIFSYFTKYPKKVERDYRQFFYLLSTGIGITTTLQDIHMGEFSVPALLDLPQDLDRAQIDEHLNKYSEFLADTIQKKFIKNDVISTIGDGQYCFKEDSPHVVIYFHSSFAVPPKSLVNLYQLIRKLLSNTKDGASLQKKVIIVLPTVLPSKKEFTFSENIEQECEAGHVILFDQGGISIRPAFQQELIFNQHKTQHKEQTIRMLEAKLVGRIGHFQREYEENGKAVKSCHLYFYDGSKCIEEVTELLKQKVGEHYKHIVYHCPESPWLESAVLNLNLESKNSIAIYNSLNFVELNTLKDVPSGSPLLFVVDLVHTGKTIGDEVEKIKTLNGGLKIFRTSILYSGDQTSDESKQVRIGANIISYFLRVKQQTFQQGGCEMCKVYHIPFYDPNKPDPFIRLQTYFYWKLSDIYGYLHESENDKPSYRTQLPIVPKFKELLTDSGAYIANKIIKYFEKSDELNGANNYTFICPDEEAANLIGRSLENLREISVIAIPSEITQLIKDNKFNKKEIEEKYKNQEWLRALLYFELESANKSVIIFDEFTYSGEKLRLLAQLAREFNLQVVCHFPFVLYNDELQLGNEKIHSLYSFNLRLSKPA